VNKAVTQLIKVVSPKEKYGTLLRLIRGIYDGSKILVFCQTKKTSDWVSRSLQTEGYRSIAIHGDKSQKDRDKIMGLFKDQRVPILVATNLAARGLDVKDIRFVINYDFPNQMEEYVHRVGRTGRAGATGISFTFFTVEDGKFAKDLIKMLIENNQKVPDDLYNLVHDRRFRENMKRYDKSYSNHDTKNFEDYEKDGPSQRDSSSNRIPHHTSNEYHNRGAMQQSYHTARPSYPQNPFPTATTNSSQPAIQIINANVNTFTPMYTSSQQPLVPQQYMMAQMRMVQMAQQQYASGQTDGFGIPITQASNGTSIDITNIPKRANGTSRFSDAKPEEKNQSSGGPKPLSEEYRAYYSRENKAGGTSNNKLTDGEY
jgi:superfamily II DNA/RNA helicase